MLNKDKEVWASEEAIQDMKNWLPSKEDAAKMFALGIPLNTLAIQEDKTERRLKVFNDMSEGRGIDFNEYFELFGSAEWPIRSC